jgi:ATP-dependent helicase/nuclease subunit A
MEKDPKAVGNAIHGAMQYIRYENCTDPEGVHNEILRLCQEGFLSKEQAEMVDYSLISAFFETEPGKKLRSGAECLREFKFSILDDGMRYGESLAGEEVLLQGVVDCALLEEEGITILDFKTDRVTPDTLEAAVFRYRSQLDTYGEALTRIYEKPIKAKYLYFFRINQLIAV